MPDNVVLHKGWIEDTLPEFVAKNSSSIAFLHIDIDTLEAHRTAFKELAHLFVPGTIVIMDDFFDFPLWQQQGFMAFEEFCQSANFQYEYFAYKSGRERGSENGSVALRVKDIGDQ